MSRATTFSSWRIKMAKKNRSPEETKFLKLFGASDLNLNDAQGLESPFDTELGMGFSHTWDVPLSPVLPMPLDYPFELSTPLNVHGQIQTGDESPVPADKAGSFLPALTAGTVKSEQVSHDTGKNELDELLAFLSQAGHSVSEVKALPSGAMRITVDDLMAMSQVRQPSLVRVRD
jgi:hypothetical protein